MNRQKCLKKCPCAKKCNKGYNGYYVKKADRPSLPKSLGLGTTVVYPKKSKKTKTKPKKTKTKTKKKTKKGKPKTKSRKMR